MLPKAVLVRWIIGFEPQARYFSINPQRLSGLRTQRCRAFSSFTTLWVISSKCESD